MDFDLKDVLTYLPKIKEYVEKAKEYMPKIVEFEQSKLTTEEKASNCKVVYAIMLVGKKAFIYVWVMKPDGDDIKVERQIAKIDVMEILDSPEVFLIKMLG